MSDQKTSTSSDIVSCELKEIKRLTRDLFESKVNELFFLSPSEVMQMANNKQSSTIEVWLARIVVKAIDSGDIKSLQFLLDRIIGPVKTQTAQTYKSVDEGGTNLTWVEYIESYGTDDFSSD